jgi:hypothetical protein
MDHLEPVRRKIRTAPIADPPRPWTRTGAHAVGGLIEVGFADDSDYLLVVSSQGRGVIDCGGGERVARDRAEPDDSWYDERRLRARGIGPLEGKTIRLAGLHGGGMLNGGRDGWSVEALAVDWPDVSLLLVEPWRSIYEDSARFTKLAVEREVRAFGFSDTGASFVIATSSDVVVYTWQQSRGERRRSTAVTHEESDEDCP